MLYKCSILSACCWKTQTDDDTFNVTVAYYGMSILQIIYVYKIEPEEVGWRGPIWRVDSNISVALWDGENIPWSVV